MNGREILDALKPESTDAEIIDALLDAFFVAELGRPYCAELQHTLNRVRRERLQQKLWPKPEDAPVAPAPPEPVQELAEPPKRSRKR